MPTSKPSTLVVARIVDAFGVKGWVKVRSFTENPENLLQFNIWRLQVAGKNERCFEVVNARLNGRFVNAQLAGVCDRDQALELKGTNVSIELTELPQLDEGEFYWSELIGLRVTNTDGADYGTIEQILETGANDVLIVKGQDTHLIPYIPDVIQKVDLEVGVIHVEWFAFD